MKFSPLLAFFVCLVVLPFFGLVGHAANIGLTEDEKAWREEHPVIRFTSDPDWLPFEAFDAEGKYIGIVAEYLSLVEAISGIKIKYIQPDNWTHVLKMAKAKDVDMIHAMKTEERKAFLNFANPHLELPVAVVAMQEKKGSLDLEKFEGLNVAMPKDYAFLGAFREKYPAAKIIEVASVSKGLMDLSVGEYDVYVDTISVCNYKISEMALNNLAVVGNTELEMSLCFGVRDDWPELVSILNKAMAKVPELEFTNIKKKWGATVAMEEVRPTDVREGNLPILPVLMVVMIIGGLGFIAWRMLSQSNADPLTFKFSSKRAKGFAFSGLALLVALVAIAASIVLESIRQRVKEDFEVSLDVVLKATDEALQIWLRTHQENLATMAEANEVQLAVEGLLDMERTPETLRKSPDQYFLRNYIRNYGARADLDGFFIIAPDYTSLASMRDGNIGSPNIISKTRRSLLDRAFAGEIVFIPPVMSEIQVAEGVGQAPTSFFAAPIINEYDEVIAVMTIRVDPAMDFTRIMQTGRIGRSGETYAFDKDGLLVSESRFEEGLRELGILDPGEKGILNLEIRIPEQSGVRAGQGRPLTKMAASAVSGNNGMDIEGYLDYRGVKVIGAWMWDENAGIGLVSEIDYDEAYQTYFFVRSTLWILLGITLTLCVGSTVFSFFIGDKANQALEAAKEDLENKVQKRTQELSDREKNFRELLEAVQDALIVIDTDSYIRRVNKVTRSVFGYEQGELVGQKIDILIPEAGRVGHAAKVKRLFDKDNDSVVNLDVKGVRKNGEIFPVDVQISSIATDDGVMAMASVRDITERKEIEDRMKKVLQLSDTALDLTKAGYWEVPFDGTGEYISSPQKVAILGDPPREDNRYHLEKEWYPKLEEVDPVLARETMESFQRAIDMDGHVFDSEYPYKRPSDGSIIWLHSVGKVTRDKNGNPTEMIGVTQDITQVKEVENAVRSSQERLDLALKASNMGLWDLDLETDELYTNSIWQTMLGHLEDEDLGGQKEMWASRLHPDDKNTVLGLLDVHLSGLSEFYRSEYRLRCADGTYKWILDIGQVTERDENDKALRIIGIHMDIDEMVKLQDDLLATKEEAIAATQAKSDFLANMSHEIRTPMNAILGMTHLCLQTELTNKQSDYLNKIHASASSLLGIINDILDFSKIEAGKLDVESVPFDLAEVLENVSTLVSVKAQEKELEFLVRRNPDVPTQLLGDPLRLSQVLVNLSNNAVKFTSEGEIVISVQKVGYKDVGDGEKKLCLNFTVRDTGIGLSKAQQNKLFQSFSQADTTTTRKYGGTGLGLAISKNLVELMDGEIWVESEQGEGSSFIFTILAGENESPQAPKPLLPSLDIRQLDVLVVDDNATSREIFQDMLQHSTTSIDLAASGEDAVDKFKEALEGGKNYELVIMDWRMPGLDGFGAIQEIRKLPGIKAQPKFIMTTAYGRDEVIKQADEMELDGLLFKPVTASTLNDAIMQAFGKDVQPRATQKTKAEIDEQALDQRRGARILLVEDNELNQQVASEMLEGAGFYVDIANNGQEGVDMVDPFVHEVVLMDIQMPVMDGYTATRTMREKPELAAVPILAMSANAMVADIKQSKDAGMNDHIAKPIDPSILFSKLIEFIKEGNRALPEGYGKKTQEEGDMLPKSVPGLNISEGLQRIGGSQNSYRKLLKKFITNQGGAIEDVNSAIQAKDQEAAVRAAHTLKGVSGNIGATDLFGAAKTLEDALKESLEGDLSKLLESTAGELAQVIESIQGLEPKEETSAQAEDATAGKPLDLKAINQAILELEGLLEDFDTDAGEVVTKISSMVHPPLKSVMDEISNFVDAYDFDGATSKLEEFRKLLDS